MKKMSKILSIFFASVLLITSFSATAIQAQASTTLFSESSAINDSDYYNEYCFTLDSAAYINISFSSTKNVELDLYNDDLEDYALVTTTSYNDTFYAPAGDYYLFLSETDYDYDDNGIYCYFSVNISDVTKQASSIKLNKKKVTISLAEGYSLNYTCSPSTAIPKSVKWSSSNKKVAVVSSNGYVTPKGLGTAEIKAKTNNGKSAKCKVTVNHTYLGIFTGSSKSLPKINGKKAKWTSKNKKVAKIKDGKVYAVKAGNTTLKCKKGKVTYTVKVHCASYNTLLKKTKSKLKDNLKDPDSLKIYHIWRGYSINDYGYQDPTIILDYGAKNSYGAMVRGDYCMGYSLYDSQKKKTVYYQYTSETKLKIKSSKKLF